MQRGLNRRHTSFSKSIEMTAIFEPSDEGGYIVCVQEISGINKQGETIEKAKEKLADAVNLVFEEMQKRHFKKRFGLGFPYHYG